MKEFGKSPFRKFTPPPATRGGWTGFINKEPEKPLTGKVQNLKAAQGEERFSRTLDKAKKKRLVTNYFFRMSPGVPKQMPGWRELDFLVQTLTNTVAISVKGAGFVHKDTAAKDKLDELLLLSRLKKLGYSVRKIETIFDYQLATQEMADKVGKSLGVYR